MHCDLTLVTIVNRQVGGMIPNSPCSPFDSENMQNIRVDQVFVDETAYPVPIPSFLFCHQ